MSEREIGKEGNRIETWPIIPPTKEGWKGERTEKERNQLNEDIKKKERRGVGKKGHEQNRNETYNPHRRKKEGKKKERKRTEKERKEIRREGNRTEQYTPGEGRQKDE